MTTAKYRLFPLLALAAIAAVAQATTGRATPDPVACTGYPEPRIYLESQSWWTPQQTSGQVGHIHVGLCYPLYQSLSGDTLHLDITVKLHGMQGATPGRLIVQAYGDVGGPDGPLVPACATADCTYTYGYDFPMTALHYSGWRAFQVYLPAFQPDGAKQYNVPRWQIYVVRDLPPAPVGSTGSVYDPLVGGDSWYRPVPTVTAYSRADIARASIPWNETTGELTPVPASWTPSVVFAAEHDFVYIDPALHAVPPSNGIVVLDENHPGGQARTLTIDTTTLANGVHHLMVGSGRDSGVGVNTGVLVVPFLVHNVVCT